ncbi:transcriptional regulator CynR [Streptomyces phaeofaciens JCM 4814]|uniref:Transcription regulator LysR family protein n=1 Tax=Streptomyces phaeofaciens TaxID=68254 RepID=A0A918LZH6_9ACTN|nr:transcriptional regulator CynR [Streptomyces phaeofaciens]GGT83358.1 transcription regulator LysR family protein [Streptomyces phaeofaciens]
MAALELRHLRYLLAVAEHANFTRAAEALHVSQPTLSQQIRQLERSLHVQLLDRSGRTVRLTDAGATYVQYARRALRELAAGERAMLDVQDLSRGTLRLAATPTFTLYLIGPLVTDFHTRHPGITLEIAELAQDRIESDLLDDRLDVGIAFEGDHLPAIDSTALYTETLSLVVGTGHPCSNRREPLPVRELRDHPLALLSRDFATRRQIDEYLAGHGVRPGIAVEANSVHALLEIVHGGRLATVLPDALAREHVPLHPVPLDPPLPPRTVALLRRESAYQSAAARAFTELARQWVRARGYTPA